MKFISTITILSCIWPERPSAFPLAERDGPAVVGMTIERGDYGDASLYDRRRDTLVVPLANARKNYFVNIDFGTPPQTIRLDIDTGSSDTWVPWAGAPICTSCGLLSCCPSGSYDPSNSLTYNPITPTEVFSISYEDNTYANGYYVTDMLDIGGAQLTSEQFAVADNTTLESGLMGIGLIADETSTPYPNVPQSLANQGFIHTPAYSIWLNNLSSSTGQVLFGGINRSKYYDPLNTYNISDLGHQLGKLMVDLVGVTINGAPTLDVPFPTGVTAIPVLLDTGNTLMNLQKELLDPIVTYFSAAYYAPSDIYSVDCALANDLSTIDFTFQSSLTISVPMSELVDTTVELTQGQCRFGLRSTPSDGLNSLGDTFLRSAYVVYDLKNWEIRLAAASYAGGEDDIVEILN